MVSEGGRISLSRGREEVSLTLDSSTRGDNGTWTCSAQVYDSEGQTVSQPVVRTVELVVVGELLTAVFNISLSVPLSHTQTHILSVTNSLTHFLCLSLSLSQLLQ